MWARLHPDRIEIIHAPVGIHTDTIHHSKAIFDDWTPDELFQHLAIVPAAYVDTPPVSGAVMLSETATLVDNRVEVTRTWAEPATAVPSIAAAPAAPSAPVVSFTMDDVLRELELINEAKAYHPGADPSKFPLLAARAAETSSDLARAADAVIEGLSRVKQLS